MRLPLLAMLAALLTACATMPKPMIMSYETKTDPQLQAKVEAIDASIRAKYGIAPELTDVGLLDLKTGRVAMIHPDHIEYAASVSKIAILLAYFQLHPDAETNLDPQTRHELGMMIKASSNELATKYSRAMGLREIQKVLNRDGFYDASRGGGIWMGKHYGPNSERIGDPVANHSHGATVRQLLRFYELLDEGKLVSPAASKTMREIFASPDIPADNQMFVKALAGRNLEILRKAGWWEDWLHDTALITGPGRHYILVGLTHTPKGDPYLEDLAIAVDNLMAFDPELAKRVGADERGMHNYVLCILKTGPQDAEIKGKERDEIFAGHFANIGRLAKEGKLAVAGPFGKNDRSYRGLYIFNVATIEEAEALVALDPAVKAGIFVPELTPWYGSAAMMTVPETHVRVVKPE